MAAQAALNFQGEAGQAVLDTPVTLVPARTRRIWFLQGAGFAGLMFIGVFWMVFPLPSQTQSPSAHVSALAFNPTAPALQPHIGSAKAVRGFAPVYEGGLQGIAAQGRLQSRSPEVHFPNSDPQGHYMTQSNVATSRRGEPKMSMADMPVVAKVSQTLAGVVAVDGGTTGLDVQFGAYLAIILGLSVPVVFLIMTYIQSEAQGTATTFRQPDSIGGTRFEDE